MKKQIIVALVLAFAVTAEANTDTTAERTKVERYNVHFQTTYIYQFKPSFSEKYNGPHSLQSFEENQNSLTSTLYFGMRLWKGGELYINPELAGGSGLSGAFGLGGSTNGETFRVGNPAPTIYLARGYIRQTFALTSENGTVEPGANQLAGTQPARYIQFLLGKYCIGDLLDNNVYSNTPRTQFMNWALMNNGAWDYAANVRGYNMALTAIAQLSSVCYKASFALMPTVPNGPDLNTTISESYAVNVEAAKNYKYKGKQGNVRLLAFCNYGGFGQYSKAMTSLHSGGLPDVSATQAAGRRKLGFGISADQQVSENIGLFGRLGWNDGKTETWCYTEVDRSISAGLSFSGSAWKRSADNMGIAVVANGLSADHKNYLAAGGLGFELGDGRLNYGIETAAEFFYSFKPSRIPLWLTGDYQFVLNPGYNKDRGPVNVFSVRMHVEL